MLPSNILKYTSSCFLAAFSLVLLFPAASEAQAQNEPEVKAKYGINLYAPKDWNRQQIFLNVMRMARPWISQGDQAWDDKRPIDVDENGYVRSLLPGQKAATIMLTNLTANFPGGEYIFLYDGEGTFEWKHNGRRISSEPGREVVQVTNKDRGFTLMQVTSVNPDNYPRNMRFVKAEYEDRLDEVFAPWVLETWGDADTTRFMDLTLTNNATLSEWATRPKMEDRTFWKNGIAWEIAIEYARLSGQNIWINLPHLATDEFIRETAIMMRDQLPKETTVYYEFSNEVWNGMFRQTHYANEKGKEEGLGPETWRAGLQYYGKQCLNMFKILDEVYAGEPKERYNKVIGVQASNKGAAKIAAEGFDAYKHADSLAGAPYLTFNVPLKKSQWNPNMPTAAVVEAWSMDQLFEYLRTESLPTCKRWMNELKDLADSLGLAMISYEAGQHLSALGEVNKNETVVNLLNDANRDPRMGELYEDYLNHWTEIGGGLICLFNAMQPYTNAGAWGLLEYVGQDLSTAHKLQAVKQWASTLD